MLETLLSNRTVSVLWEALPRILSAGLTMTIPLTLVSFTLAMVLAVAVALVQYARVPVLSQLARFYIWVIRGTPLLVQLFIIFYGLPSVGIMLDAFPAAVIAFAFNEGAYCAETMRGASGPAHCRARPLQLPHRHDKGHLSGLQHHGSGAVHGRPARRRPHLHLPAHLL